MVTREDVEGYLVRMEIAFQELEEALRAVILLIQKNSLTIIVTHRLETIIKADKILMMDKGGVVCSGTHNNLLSDSELYRNFISELANKES